MRKFSTTDLFLAKAIIFILLYLNLSNVFGQIPPKQDCTNPIPVCQMVFDNPNAYPYTNPLVSGVPSLGCTPYTKETNFVWYQVRPLIDGVLALYIKETDYNGNPLVTPSYHYGIFDITDLGCNGAKLIGGGGLLECQRTLDGGQSLRGNTGQIFNGIQLAIPAPVKAGRTYNILVNRGTSALTAAEAVGKGFKIDFTGSSPGVILPPPGDITITTTSTSVCAGSSVTLIASGAGTGAMYQWTSSDGSPMSMGASKTVSPLSTTTYTVTSGAACRKSKSITIIVNPNPVVSMPSKRKCLDDYYSFVKLQPTSNIAGTTYTYSPSSYLTAVLGPVTYSNPPANIEYTVTGKTPTGCLSTAKATVTLFPRPNVNLSVTDATICEGQSLTITSTPPPANSYLYWYPNNTLSVTSNPNVVIVTPTVTTTYGALVEIAGMNGGDCGNEKIFTVNVVPKPTVSVPPLTNLCKGSSVTLTATGYGTSYSWSPVDWLNATNGTTVIATPITSKDYTVTASNGICSSSAVASVKVSDPALAFGRTFETAIDIGTIPVHKPNGCLIRFYEPVFMNECFTNIYGGMAKDVVFKFTSLDGAPIPFQSKLDDSYNWRLLNQNKVEIARYDNDFLFIPKPSLGVNYLIVEPVENVLKNIEIAIIRTTHPYCEVWDRIDNSNEVSSGKTMSLTTEVLEIVPNPSYDIIKVNSEGRKMIYNLSGKELLQSDDLNINISDLPSGMYLIKANLNGEEKIGKFVKQ